MTSAARTFVELSDLLVGGLEGPADRDRLATLCATLIEVPSMGLLGRDADGELGLVAAADDPAELLIRYELAYDQGPGVDVFRTGERVECVDVSAARLRWPRFAPVARNAGVAAAHGPCTRRRAAR